MEREDVKAMGAEVDKMWQRCEQCFVACAIWWVAGCTFGIAFECVPFAPLIAIIIGGTLLCLVPFFAQAERAERAICRVNENTARLKSAREAIKGEG